MGQRVEIEYFDKRYEICTKCIEFNNMLKTCNICGCFMPVKVKFKSNSCPIDLWTSIDENQNNDRL